MCMLAKLDTLFEATRADVRHRLSLEIFRANLCDLDPLAQGEGSKLSGGSSCHDVPHALVCKLTVKQCQRVCNPRDGR